MNRIDLVFFDAGGGHRTAATALKNVIEQQGRPWSVHLMNLQEVLDSLDIFRKLTGIRMQDIYNHMLAKGWTLGSEHLLPAMHGVIRMYHPAQVRMLEEIWRRDTPDMVVSVVPNFNRAFYEALRRIDPGIPLVTILTDLADFPPHFWMEKQDQYILCGTERAAQQAKGMSYKAERIFRTSGMILRPGFYQKYDHDVGAERRKLGLSPERPTGVVLFGGQGSPVMLEIARRLQNVDRELQLIMICGRNEKLAAQLGGIEGKTPLHIVGFTSEVPYYMSLADFFIGKPGPGSISEALAMKLPVIVERNAWTLPQERFNAEWVQERQAGIVVPNFRQIGHAVSQLLEPDAFRCYRARAAAVHNRAVFEIPDILERILVSK